MTTFTQRTQNPEWGFHGTIGSQGHSDPDTDTIYAAMGTRLMAVLGYTEAQARFLLDARDGRHLADAVGGGYADILDDDEQLVRRADASGLHDAIHGGDFDRLLNRWAKSFRRALKEME